MGYRFWRLTFLHPPGILRAFWGMLPSNNFCESQWALRKSKPKIFHRWWIVDLKLEPKSSVSSIIDGNPKYIKFLEKQELRDRTLTHAFDPPRIFRDGIWEGILWPPGFHELVAHFPNADMRTVTFPGSDMCSLIYTSVIPRFHKIFG